MKMSSADKKCCNFYRQINSAGGDFSGLLIAFANSLDPDQARQNVELDLDPNCFDTLAVFLE